MDRLKRRSVYATSSSQPEAIHKTRVVGSGELDRLIADAVPNK